MGVCIRHSPFHCTRPGSHVALAFHFLLGTSCRFASLENSTFFVRSLSQTHVRPILINHLSDSPSFIIVL